MAGPLLPGLCVTRQPNERSNMFQTNHCPRPNSPNLQLSRDRDERSTQIGCDSRNGPRYPWAVPTDSSAGSIRLDDPHGFTVALCCISGPAPGLWLAGQLPRRSNPMAGEQMFNLEFPRHPVEYTLAPCPIIWDHLTLDRAETLGEITWQGDLLPRFLTRVLRAARHPSRDPRMCDISC